MVEATASKRRPRYEEEVPSQQELVKRRESLQVRHGDNVRRVADLARVQRELSADMGTDLGAIRDQASLLDELERRATDTSLLAVLTRAFARRNAILERRSVAEGLLHKYERASRCLRRASAFSDELRACALELQQHVDALHEQVEVASRDCKRAATAIVALDAAIQRLEAGSDEADQALLERRLDDLRFRLRSETLALELFEASRDLAMGEQPSTRALRDTVMELHEEMARFVLNAESAVNTAGRRIQALGMAADAPTVVGELRESMAELGQAMEATERYVEQAQHLLTHVLPDLNAELEKRAAVDGTLLVDDLDAISRERSRELARRALREAAEAEVEALTGGEA